MCRPHHFAKSQLCSLNLLLGVQQAFKLRRRRKKREKKNSHSEREGFATFVVVVGSHRHKKSLSHNLCVRIFSLFFAPSSHRHARTIVRSPLLFILLLLFLFFRQTCSKRLEFQSHPKLNPLDRSSTCVCVFLFTQRALTHRFLIVCVCLHPSVDSAHCFSMRELAHLFALCCVRCFVRSSRQTSSKYSCLHLSLTSQAAATAHTTQWIRRHREQLIMNFSFTLFLSFLLPTAHD